MGSLLARLVLLDPTHETGVGAVVVPAEEVDTLLVEEVADPAGTSKYCTSEHGLLLLEAVSSTRCAVSHLCGGGVGSPRTQDPL